MSLKAELNLPLFPLQSVLFPDGLLALQIFEVRYLDMIGRCHKENKPFGVVSLTQGREVRQTISPGNNAGSELEGRSSFVAEGFHVVGTLAHITELKRPQPGLMLIQCTGGQRFRLLQSDQLKHGLWMGASEPVANDPVVAVPADLLHVQRALQNVLNHLQTLSEEETVDMPKPYRWDDCGWLANRWCELLPLRPAMKQQFMALESPLVRLELVADLLENFELPKPPA